MKGRRLFSAINDRKEVSVAQLAAGARRRLAAECHSFLFEADPKSEKWEPYLRWEHSLTGDDAVITFNYDLVLETLARANAEDSSGTEIVLPGVSRQNSKKAPVYKLHGSINWRRDAQGVRVAPFDHFALTCRTSEMVIASPGPSKRIETEKLESLWNAAEQVLSQANAIVFVGYRFPPTDATARRRILRGIAMNAADTFNIYSALGDDVASARRLAAMLKYQLGPSARHANEKFGLKDYGIATDPMFAQDFLDLYSRAHLVQSRPPGP